MSEIRYPNITGKNPAEQLAQMKSFLYQLVEHLNAASTVAERVVISPAPTPMTAQSIKALILKSADIVEKYGDMISQKLQGVYVAQSDFGVYTQQTQQTITQTAEKTQQLFSELQQIVSQISQFESVIIDVTAHIHSGLLYHDTDGTPVYGVEVGQKTIRDGVEVFDKFARFTADKLAFYDCNGIEVAYISDRKLYITHAHITGSFLEGGLQDFVQPDGSIVTRWVGTGG